MPMVTIRYFAHTRTLTGTGSEIIELPSACEVTAVHHALSSRHPQLKHILSHTRIALNHDFVQHSLTLCDGDELAIIPPVSGG